MTLPRSEWALSGAGTLAGLHVGATAALLDAAPPDDLKGSSAGAIIAACIATGMTPKQMHDAVVSADYAELIPIDYLEAPFRGDLASTDNVSAYLQDLTRNQLLGDCEIPLTCITSDLQTGKMATFSTKQNPDMPIWQAVLASMSIPDVFPLFQGRYADGGVVCNLGVPLVLQSKRAIAFRVTESNKTGPVDGFVDEQERLIGMMLSASEWGMVRLAEQANIPVVNLPGGNLGFLNRAMTQTQKEGLYTAGFQAMQTFLESDAGKEWLK